MEFPAYAGLDKDQVSQNLLIEACTDEKEDEDEAWLTRWPHARSFATFVSHSVCDDKDTWLLYEQKNLHASVVSFFAYRTKPMLGHYDDHDRMLKTNKRFYGLDLNTSELTPKLG